MKRDENENTPIVYYLFCEELFDVIHEAHQRVGHGGENKMVNELKNKFANVSFFIIKLYISFCEGCTLKNTKIC